VSLRRLVSGSSLGLLVRHRPFALVWSAGLVSMIGDWMLAVVLPIRIFELTGSPLAVAGLIASLYLPLIVFSSVAGVLVDRWDRRRTMILSGGLQAGVVLPLLLVDSRATAWIAFPVIAVAASLFAFSEPAENAFLPRLVGEDELVAANARNALNNNLARLVGPAVGGLLFVLGGLELVTLFDAGTFVAGALLVAAVRVSGRPEPAPAKNDTEAEARPATGMVGELRDGLRVIRRSRPVSVVLGVTAVTSIGEGIFGVMFLVWVVDVLDGGVAERGLFASTQALGGILGAVIAGSLAARRTPATLFGAGLVVFGVLDLILFNYPLVFSSVILGLGLMTLVGIPTVAMQAARQTILQESVEDSYRGRVFGVIGMTQAAFLLAATLVAGAVGETVGPIAMLNVQGLGYVVSGAFVLLALAPHALARVREHAVARE
jgi:Na+/melibiose symporter-like transporter